MASVIILIEINQNNNDMTRTLLSFCAMLPMAASAEELRDTTFTVNDKTIVVSDTRVAPRCYPVSLTIGLMLW